MTDEVKVVASLVLQDGKRDEVIALWPALARQVRAESGCLAYDLHSVLGDANRLLVLERWASVEALAAHGESPHMAEFGQVAAGLVAGAPEVLVLPATPLA
jgi:quinol monooxygenase YgiN